MACRLPASVQALLLAALLPRGLAAAEERHLQAAAHGDGLHDGLEDSDLGRAAAWLSHIFLGLFGFFYLLSGGMVIPNGMFLLGRMGGEKAPDTVLRELGVDTPEKAYEAARNTEDRAMKQLLFWAVVLFRAKAFFEAGFGIYNWLLVAFVPVRFRAPFHFANSALQLGEALILEMQLMGAAGCGVDPGKKFGEAAASAAQVEPFDAQGTQGSKGFDAMRPFFKSGMINHCVVATINITCGVLVLVARE